MQQTQLDRIEAKVDDLRDKLTDHKVSIVERVARLESGSTILWLVLVPATLGVAGLLVKLTLQGN